MSQAIGNVLISAAVYTMVGIGFSVVYSTLRFFNFAFAGFITVTPYTAYWLGANLQLPPLMALGGGIVASVLLAAALEVVAFNPLRSQQDFPTKALIVSLGLYTAIQAAISLAFGTTSLAMTAVPMESRLILGARFTNVQLLTIASAAVATLVMSLLLRNTAIGTRIRAVGDDRNLALIYGCNPDAIGFVTVVCGAVLGGLAGWLVAMDSALTPMLGFSVLLGGVVVTIIGGVGNVWGIAAAALLIASLEQAAGWWISSAWERFVVFASLLLFILQSPRKTLSALSRRR